MYSSHPPSISLCYILTRPLLLPSLLSPTLSPTRFPQQHARNHTWAGCTITFTHTNTCRQADAWPHNQPHTCRLTRHHTNTTAPFALFLCLPIRTSTHTHTHTLSDVITVSAESAVQRCETSKCKCPPSIIKSFLGIGQLTVSALRIVSLYFNQSYSLHCKNPFRLPNDIGLLSSDSVTDYVGFGGETRFVVMFVQAACFCAFQ